MGICTKTISSSNFLLTAISTVHIIRAVEDTLNISGKSAWKALDPEEIFSGILSQKQAMDKLSYLDKTVPDKVRKHMRYFL